MSKLILPNKPNARQIVSISDIENQVDNAYLGLEYGFTDDKIYNALLDISHSKLYENPFTEILDIMANPKYFYYTCKYLFGVKLLPFQLLILQELWTRKFPMLIASRGAGKSFILSLYAVLRALLQQGSKIVVVGAAFRQSKLLFEYMEGFWRSSPILQNITGMSKHQGPKRDIDRCSFYLGDSEIIAIPLGSGEKIRGLRAHYTIADEFGSISQEIFEVVIKGFSSVSANPADRVKNMARVKILKTLGMYQEADDARDDIGFGNQTVISGTAYYSFNHFYEYWKRYKDIIESCGDQHKLEEVFKGEVPSEFNWKDFSIFRIPATKLPYGFMDESQLHQAKATISRSIYNMEYGAAWARDSDGFFKRSLIESCVTKEPINLPSGPVHFSAMIRGNSLCKYVYGIDPASEKDNFSIVILEVYPDHRRIVYSWSITRQQMRDRMKNKGESSNKSFYTYCAQKIRELMYIFPTEHIVMDAQGGGITIMEALHEQEIMKPGELPIWPYIKRGDEDELWWEEKDKPTDGEAGLHILHIIQFANLKLVQEANHGMRKDFESKMLLFPYFDAITISEAINIDKLQNRLYDTLEDAVMEIEELKDELATIRHTQTEAGRDRWDTPEIKLPGNKKGRLRKDRYSALVIANMVARCMSNKISQPAHIFVGGYAGEERIKREAENCHGRMYTGPDHIVSKMNFLGYGIGINRNG